MEPSPQAERRFVQHGLPWVIAAAALVLYGATLSHWLTLNSLPVTAEVSGWSSQPALYQPVLFLLTWPLRWLPAGWSPLALNLFAAVCASLTLALLARSVTLLPQGRLEQQRLLVQNEHGLLSLRSAWVPPVLAAVALGLQLTFWEYATAASLEMVDLLLFAGVIWCLLKHRLEPRLCWLDRAAVLSGLALANNWAMAAFLPLVAVALIRSRRLRFFNVPFLEQIESSAWRKAMPALGQDIRFFLRMVLFGLAGLSLLLLLPLVQTFSPDLSLSFLEALRKVGGSYYTTLLGVGRSFFYHKEVSLLLLAVSLVPLLLLSIRWHTSAGPESTQRPDLVSFILYAAHAFLLLLCVSVAFDPPFSPRQLSPRLGFIAPFLPLYYLSALSIGYYSGFFLLIFSGYLGRRWVVLRALRWTAPKLVYVLLGVTLAGLLWKNLPIIRLANGRQLEQYAGFLAGSLPPEGAVVCSHDSSRLALLRALLAREGKAERYVPVDLSALASERYRARLRKNYPRQWTEPEDAAKPDAVSGSASPASPVLELVSDLRLLVRLAQSNRVCCLEPDFQYLAEQFNFRSHGLVYELKPYPTNAFSGTLLTATELAQNEAIWQQVIETGVNPLARSIAEVEAPKPGFAGWLLERAYLTKPVPGSLRALARLYSSALDSWGVTLQCNDQWRAATSCFAKATELNLDNFSAQVNLQCNTNRLAGRELALAPPKSVEEQLISRSQLMSRSPNALLLLAAYGPFDEPAYCLRLGEHYAKQDPPLPRQAWHLFERARTLAPKEIRPRLLAGSLLNRYGQPDRALQMVAEIQADRSLQPLSPEVNKEIGFLEADSWFAKGDPAKAAKIVLALVDAYPQDPALLARAEDAFTKLGSYTNALRMTDMQLQLAPDNLQALMDKGVLSLMAGEFSNAIPAFTRVLSLTNSYSGRMNRAQAYLQTGQWDAANADYREALRAFTNFYQPYEGLAQVAYRRGDTNAANQYYRQGRSNALRIADQQLRLTPDNLQALLEKAVLYMQARDFSNAIPVYTRILSLTNSYGARMDRAQAYLETSQWNAAAADYREALRAFPNSYQPYEGLAQVAFRRGDTNAANQYLRQGRSNALRIADQQLRLTPDNLQALLEKAVLHMQARDFSNAIPVYTRILSLTNSYGARMDRARAFLQTGQSDAAAADYQEVIRAFPASSDPYQGLAEVAFRRGDTNSANQYYRQGLSNALRIADQRLQLAPDNLQALLDKGVLCMQAREFSNAIPVFTHILSLTNIYRPRMYRAQAYLQTGQWEAASADYQEVLRAFPEAYDPYAFLAEVALQRGNTNAAIGYYQQYLSRAPTNQADFRSVAARLQSLQSRTP